MIVKPRSCRCSGQSVNKRADAQERYGLLKLPSMASMITTQVMQQEVAGNKAQEGSDQSSQIRNASFYTPRLLFQLSTFF